MANIRGYIGTYTKGDSKGVYTFTLNTDKQQIEQVEVAAELENPTYLTVSEDQKFVYAVVKKDHRAALLRIKLIQQQADFTSSTKSLPMELLLVTSAWTVKRKRRIQQTIIKGQQRCMRSMLKMAQ